MEDDDYNLKDELLAACALLGRRVDQNEYIKGEECVETLKDLQQFLHRDDSVGDIDQPNSVDSLGRRVAPRVPWELHRALADWNILQNHVLPLIASYAGDDPEILYECMVVTYLMTSLPPLPIVHLDDEKDVRAQKHKVYGAALVPAFEALAIFKEQFANSQDVLTIIMKWLMDPLLHEGSDRTEPEMLVLDLVLNLIRNLLQMQPPAGSMVELPTALVAKLAMAQDTLILKMAEENVLEMLILLAQQIEEEENRNWNLLLLDIFALIFVKEDPTEVLASTEISSGDWLNSMRRELLLKSIPKAETNTMRKSTCFSRHQRFAGLFQVKTNEEVKFVSHKIDAVRSEGPRKTMRAGPRRKPLMEVRVNRQKDRSDVLKTLDSYASTFLEVGFNSLLGTVTYDYAMESAALVASDDLNFATVSAWFLHYFRLKEKRRIASLPPRPKPSKEKESQEASQAGLTEELVLSVANATSSSEANHVESYVSQCVAAHEHGEKAREETHEHGEEAREETHEHGEKAREESKSKAGEDATASSLSRADEEGRVERQLNFDEAQGEEAMKEPASEAEHGEARGAEASQPHGEEATMKEVMTDKHQEAEQDEKEEGGKEEEEEEVDPYDYNAAFVSSLVDLSNLRWVLEKINVLMKPERGSGGAQHHKVPPFISMLRELVLTVQSLYFSYSRHNKDVASQLLRNLVYEWDLGDTLLCIIKDFRPFRNTRSHLADVVDLTHTLLRLIKSFSEDNQNLQRLKKRRRRRNRRGVEKAEGEGEWLGGESEEEILDEEYHEVMFNFNSYLKRFAHPQVVSTYVHLLSHYRVNSDQTNHQVVKMLDVIARKCEFLPMLFQLSAFRIFDRILSDSSLDGKDKYKEMVNFVRWIVREFFKLSLVSPCLFLELLAWTRSARDAELIANAYKPVVEERSRKPGKGEEAILQQIGRSAGKWTEDDDLALREAHQQFGSKANALQLISMLLEGKSVKQIALRMNKLGLVRVGHDDWSEGEEEEEEEDLFSSRQDLYTCARRLRNARPAALDWIVDNLALACRASEEMRLAAGRSEERASFLRVQDFSLVPTKSAEWEHAIDPLVSKLLCSMRLLGPRPTEGHAFWRFPASLLEDEERAEKMLEELRGVQEIPVEETRRAEVEATPDPPARTQEDATSSMATRPKRRVREATSESENEEENGRRYNFKNLSEEEEEEEEGEEKQGKEMEKEVDEMELEGEEKKDDQEEGEEEEARDIVALPLSLVDKFRSDQLAGRKRLRRVALSDESDNE
ncbi:timeless [Guillardia theta CCMP2712]|uniref:Timeless n=2 Tax=Guillardia theta TaxID=55529 RepID=L1I7H0_GUITC|nr:timeless [Guillardia theta CCMP2712]EKX31824.1 timeless [Guillardia theta CCMP2712]|eukprot:XP_005818804.1 timeless [Guillardia theta CCMP2712]